MKKTISKSLLMLATAGFFMTSCGNENIGIEDHLIDRGGDNGVKISRINKVSNLESVTFNAEVIGSVAKVDIMYNGTVLASVDNPESKFELILKRSDITGLGNAETATQNIDVLVTLSNGKVIKYLKSLTYSQAVDLAEPETLSVGEVNDTEAFIYTVNLSEGISQELVKDVKVMYKINSNEYIELAKPSGTSWSILTDTLSLDALSIAANDTFNVKVVARNAENITSFIESTPIIIK